MRSNELEQPTRYSWHPLPVSTRYVIAFGILIGTIVCWWLTRGSGEWPLRIFSAIFSIAALGMLTEFVTWVDRTEQKLHREGLLLGRIRVWRRTWRLSEFRGIVVKRHVDSDEQVRIYVELLRLSGRRLGVRYFLGQAFGEPQRVAQELARVTGLQVTEE